MLLLDDGVPAEPTLKAFVHEAKSPISPRRILSLIWALPSSIVYPIFRITPVSSHQKNIRPPPRNNHQR